MSFSNALIKFSQEKYGLNIQRDKFEEKYSVYYSNELSLSNVIGNLAATINHFLDEESQPSVGIDLADVKPFFEGEDRLVLINQFSKDAKEFKENFHMAVKNMSKDVTGSARKVLLLVRGEMTEFGLGDLQDLAEGMMEFLPEEVELVMGMDIHERDEEFDRLCEDEYIEDLYEDEEVVDVMDESPSISLNCLIM